MPNTQFAELANCLIEKTREGKIQWLSTKESTSVHCEFGKYHVVLTNAIRSGTEGQYSYTLSICLDRKAVGSFDDLDLKQHEKRPGSAYKDMKEMFELATQNSVGLSEALTTILGQLKES